MVDGLDYTGGTAALQQVPVGVAIQAAGNFLSRKCPGNRAGEHHATTILMHLLLYDAHVTHVCLFFCTSYFFVQYMRVSKNRISG